MSLLCSMVFSPNDSPLAGREGMHLTGSKIGERLAQEAATSVSLRIIPVKGGGEAFEVQARGELQLGLLIGGRLSCFKHGQPWLPVLMISISPPCYNAVGSVSVSRWHCAA